MHWTYGDLMALSPDVYDELVAWLNSGGKIGPDSDE
jgi:hypothetical protein